MKIGITQSTFRRFGDFSKQTQLMRAHGFEAMDFSEFTNYPVEKIFTLGAKDFEKTLREYARIAVENGIEITQTHAPWIYPRANQTAEELEILMQKLFQSIEGTAMLGCGSIVVHPFLPFTSHDLDHEDETVEMNIRLLKKLCDKARETNVDLCLENMPMSRFSVATVRRIVSMVDVVCDERLKVCLDTGHCNVFEVRQSTAIKQIGKDRLKVLHVHDNHAVKDEHLFPYEGNIDWADFAAGLKEIGFEGALSLETDPNENLPDELYLSAVDDLFNRAKYIAKMAE
ncbi:MAG: sugar phosphate isomerase/epimerase [Clostridia bacterium]|nr:sugar phosphate isomerase/epimerase [Clostridia bacterium]